MKSSRRKQFVVHWLTALALTALLTVLYFFNPAEHSFYPHCLFHSLTGWNCPGCGSTRALHQLLHGNFLRAFQLNPVFVLLLPLLGIFALRRRVQRSNDPRHSSTKDDYV